ncbi:MAG: putative Actin type 5 [Streblomastix strix]|uniref:Putative Actin type 5 n=1 Tax=Streblomastix strix TaxID=222440 RepID=A0A5J4WDC5_9EUKA|nr:MAG: putative Actin type 5 [Streblomastix strix]
MDLVYVGLDLLEMMHHAQSFRILQGVRKLIQVSSDLEIENVIQEMKHNCVVMPYDYVIQWNTHHIFYNEFRVDSEEHPVLLTEPQMNPKSNREKMTTVITIGIILDSGIEVLSLMPMIQGYNILHASISIYIGGRDQNENLKRLHTESGYFFRIKAIREILSDFKEKLYYITVDYHSEMQTVASSTSIIRTYEMPD